MRIGIIGAGQIGGTLGYLFGKAGHWVFHGTRNAPPASTEAGTPAEAATFGEVVVFAAPFGAWPEFARETAAVLAGKVVIDAANPYPARDGAVAEGVLGSGRSSAEYVAALLPESRIVKSFNTLYWLDLRHEAGRPGERLAMPIAGDDAGAVAIAEALARDAGFDPVLVEGLDRSRALDPGSPIYAKSMTADAIRAALGLMAETRGTGGDA